MHIYEKSAKKFFETVEGGGSKTVAQKSKKCIFHTFELFKSIFPNEVSPSGFPSLPLFTNDGQHTNVICPASCC